MTSSSTNELFTPYKEPEREFRSSMRHFKTPSRDELRSSDFNLLSNQDYSEEEIAETMAETMEQYMSKTRADYGSRVASGFDHEDANEHIDKVLKIVDIFHIPNITIDQVMLRAFPMSLTGAEVILFYNGLEIPTQQILDLRGAIPSKTAADAKLAIQEMAEYSQKWHNGTSKSRSTETSNGLATTQAQLNNLGKEIKKVNEKVYATQTRRNSNLIKEIRASMDAAVRNQGVSIKTLEIQIRQVSKVLQERGFGSLPISIKANPRDQVKSILTTIEADSCSICRIGSSQYVVSTGQNRTLIVLVDLGASVSVMPLLTYLNLGLVELRRNQGDDLMPTIEEGKVIEEFKTKDDELDIGTDDYPIYCDYDKKIHIDCAYNLNLENMDAYHEEGMGDVIGEPFLKEVGIKARRIEGRITLYKDDKSVNDEDMMNGISHPYQKLKGFYKGVLNLGPDYIRDARMEKWVTCGHISVHEME
uniref:Reverse transcriptase domain-containing protein n=1 Tax=Tanacetum cinerariifolium TaxID=118510 RepID=A0A6L2NC00_TANCI|nr:hypothetical protein [Tanacetum cinerariifolium]